MCVPNRKPRRLSAAVAALIGALLLLGAAGIEPAEARPYHARLLDMINHSREVHGLDALKLNVRLSGDARFHTRRMVRRNRLFDVPNLAELLEHYRWRTYGASAVGCAPSPFRLHRLLMRDKDHREIILSPDARRVGIGAVLDHGKSVCGRNAFWATEIFYG
jgi:uncharacterized protein YkwD